MGIAEYLQTHKIKDEHKKVIQGIEDYFPEDSQRKRMHSDFEGFKGGIDRFAHDTYQRAIDHFESVQKGVEGKDGDEKKKYLANASNSLVDKIILETVGNLKDNEEAQEAIRVHKTRMEHGVYDGNPDEYHGKFLGDIAEKYLGMRRDSVFEAAENAIKAMTKGDQTTYQETIAQLRDSLKNGLLKHRQGTIQQKLEDPEVRHSANVHYLLEAQKHGYEPEEAKTSWEADPLELQSVAKNIIPALKKSKEVTVDDQLKQYGFKPVKKEK